MNYVFHPVGTIACLIAAVMALRAGNGFGVALYGGGALLFAALTIRGWRAAGDPDTPPAAPARWWQVVFWYLCGAVAFLLQDVYGNRPFDIPRALVGGALLVGVVLYSRRRR